MYSSLPLCSTGFFVVLIILRDLLLVSFDDWHGYCQALLVVVGFFPMEKSDIIHISFPAYMRSMTQLLLKNEAT